MSATAADVDVISSIRAAAGSSRVSWQPRHVHGHVDKHKTWEELSWWERRNCECDQVAQALADQLLASSLSPILSSNPNPRFFSEPCAIFINGAKVCTLSLASVDEVVTVPRLRAYWAKRGRLTPEAFDVVHWDTVERAMKALPAGLQRWVSKHTTGMCGVGKFRKRWGLDSVDTCPMCPALEDHLHVPRCPSARAKAHWAQCLTHLQDWLASSRTAPFIGDFLLYLLSGVRAPLASDVAFWSRLSSADSRLFVDAQRHQRLIGPQGLLEGLLAAQWAPLQQHYLRSVGSRRSGSLLASQLSQQLILVGFQMWTLRNSVFHSDDFIGARQQRNVLDVRVKSAFRAGASGLPALVRPMLRRSLRATVLAYSNDDKEEWLTIVETARRRALRNARRPLAAQRRLLWRYFHPPS